MTSLWLDRSDEIQTEPFHPGMEYDDVVGRAPGSRE